MALEELIKQLKQIDEEEINTARYSLDTVTKLTRISEQIKTIAREVNQCCY